MCSGMHWAVAALTALLRLFEQLQGSWAALNVVAPVACTAAAEGCASAQDTCTAGVEKIAISACLFLHVHAVRMRR